MTRLPIPAAMAAACLAAAAFLAAPARAQTEEVVKSTHGDWQVVCATAEGREVCAIRQVAKDSQGNDILAVSVRALDDAQTEDGRPVPAIVDIVAPLGVALRAGVRVRVDGGEERAAPFEICRANGCLVRSPMGEEFLNAFKRGANAAMTVVAPQQGEVTVTVSLRGFTAAFNEID